MLVRSTNTYLLGHFGYQLFAWTWFDMVFGVFVNDACDDFTCECCWVMSVDLAVMRK